jgi:hypothetical protein
MHYYMKTILKSYKFILLIQGSKTNPGHFPISYLNGFVGSLPKLASNDPQALRTVGKRKSTEAKGSIGNCLPIKSHL